jgi:uncharacterized protein YaaW (UPF0174 family)
MGFWSFVNGRWGLLLLRNDTIANDTGLTAGRCAQQLSQALVSCTRKSVLSRDMRGGICAAAQQVQLRSIWCIAGSVGAATDLNEIFPVPQHLR